MGQSAHLDTFAKDNLPPRDLWPEIVSDLPDLRYPDRLNCVSELLDKAIATGYGDHVAIRGTAVTWTYRELLRIVNRIALVLTQDMKLVPGNRVLLRGSNDPTMAACWLAVVKAGLIAVATTPLLRAKELSQMLDKGEIGAAVCDFSLRSELELAKGKSPALRDVIYFNSDGPDSLEARMSVISSEEFAACDTAADDVCIIAFTSGTSGSPKATMHFHRDVMVICDCFPRSTLHVSSEDVFCGTPPLGFTFGLGGLLLFPMRFGGSTVLLGALSPDSLLKAIQDYGVTICFTVPTFYRQMAALVPKYDLRSLKKTVSAGEALPLATRKLWQDATGLRLIDGIGATEMLHIFISASGDDICDGATGKPIPGYSACIVDDDGQPVPPGTVGRLAIKGPTGCRYLADERQKGYVKHGWNITGDAYVVDENGYFWHQGRVDDMIITSGYNIAGPEVEEALLRHPAVAECGVIGTPDEARGEIVKAFVVTKEGYEPSDSLVKTLQEHVKNTIAPYKYPRAIEFRTSLPRTETGKLQRFRLRQAIESSR